MRDAKQPKQMEAEILETLRRPIEKEMLAELHTYVDLSPTMKRNTSRSSWSAAERLRMSNPLPKPEDAMNSSGFSIPRTEPGIRVGVLGDCEFGWNNSHEKRATIVDISDRGMCVRCQGPLRLGMEVKATLESAPDDFKVYRVVWYPRQNPPTMVYCGSRTETLADAEDKAERFPNRCRVQSWISDPQMGLAYPDAIIPECR